MPEKKIPEIRSFSKETTHVDENLGFIAKSKPFRLMGAILFGIVVVKILLVDLGSLEPIYRTVVTMIVGMIALGAAFAYVKNKEKLAEYLK